MKVNAGEILARGASSTDPDILSMDLSKSNSSESGSKDLKGEAEFTSSSGGVRAPSVNAKKGLRNKERLETVPNSVK